MTESNSSNEAWITGIGLATSLSDSLDANWDALAQRRINVDEKGFAPYIVHPLAPVSFDAQIPKKGDQRQMEAWQRIGTYAAGLALDSAGIKGNKDILARMDMIVAAGGGERDLAVDSAILNAEAKGNSSPGFLNERLMNDLRPTLFLAQLSNLLAGNIAIVHVIDGVDVAGIVDRELRRYFRPRIGEIRQLRLVEFLENAGADLALQEIGARHHDIVAGFAGQQPRFKSLVGVEGVVDHLDAGLPSEIVQHAGRGVVRPVVEIDRSLLRGGNRCARDRQGQSRKPSHRMPSIAESTETAGVITASP